MTQDFFLTFAAHFSQVLALPLLASFRAVSLQHWRTRHCSHALPARTFLAACLQQSPPRAVADARKLVIAATASQRNNFFIWGFSVNGFGQTMPHAEHTAKAKSETTRARLKQDLP